MHTTFQGVALQFLNFIVLQEKKNVQKIVRVLAPYGTIRVADERHHPAPPKGHMHTRFYANLAFILHYKVF